MTQNRLTIDRLSLNLPAGFENRAEVISRMVASNLKDIRVSETVSVDRLQLPAIRINAGDTDARIASAVSGAVIEAVSLIKR